MSKNVSHSSAGFKSDTGIAVDIPCNEIFFDRKWNSRREVSANHSDDGGSGGYPNLVCSLATRRLDGEAFPQRDPVTVRPNPNYDEKKKGEPYRRYLGVSGFQRYDAIMFTATQREDEVAILTDPAQGGLTLAQVATLKSSNPTVRAYVKQLTEAEARAENLAENMQRSTLSGPDIAYGVMKLFEAAPDLSDTKAAIILGNNQSFVSKLRRITSGTKDVVIPGGKLYAGSPPMSILEAWREAPKKISQNDLDNIAKKESPEEKVKSYLEKTGKEIDPTTPPKPKPATGKGAWITNAINVDAPVIGMMLGTLQRLGVLTMVTDRLSDEAVRAMFAPFRNVPGDATTKGENAASHVSNMARLVDALNNAIKVGSLEPAKVTVDKATTSDGIPYAGSNGDVKHGDGKVARRAEV